MSDSGSITLDDVEVTAPAPTPASPAPQAPYAVRQIDLTFSLGTGQFGNTGANKVTFRGLRANVHVELANLPSTGMAQITAYGLTLDHMNELSRAGLVYKARNNNTVLVQAGDVISGMTTVFQGLIIEAHPVMRQPESGFFVLASPTSLAQLKPVPPVTFNGGVSAATVLGQLTQQVGWTLENNNVTAVLASPYYPGTAWQQIKAAVRDLNCFACFDSVSNTLAIWPKTSSRSGNPVVISPATGMIDYPEFQALLVKVRTLFNPSIKLGIGQQITIQSQLQAANGKFTVISVTHDLESQTPDGPWETTIIANPLS